MRTYWQFPDLYHHHEHNPPTLKLLYLAYVIRMAIFSYLCVFLPYYYYHVFYQRGWGTNRALIWTILVFVLFEVATIVGSYLSAKFSAKHSIRKVFLFSAFVLLINTLLLTLGKTLIFAVISSLLFGLHSGLWWIAYHLEYALSERTHKFGKEVGSRQAFGLLSGVGLTLVNGLLIERYGYSAMYFTTFILALGLVMIIALLDDQRRGKEFSFKLAKQELQKFPQDFTLYGTIGAETIIAEVIWPLLLFFTFKEPLLVGTVASVITLFAFIVRLVVGRLTDKIQGNKVERVGIVAVSLIWFGKALSQNPVSLMLFDSLYRVFTAFFYVPATALNYLRVLLENKTVYITTREMAAVVGRIIALVLCIGLLALNLSLWWLLLIAAIAPMLNFLAPHKAHAEITR